MKNFHGFINFSLFLETRGGYNEKMLKLIFFYEDRQNLQNLSTFLLHRYMLILFLILHCIEDYVESYIEIYTNTNEVLIIDGMTVANQIDSKTLSTCQDFEIAFMRRIGNMVSCYTKVRLIFDRYLEQALKARTREARTAGVQIRYSKIFLF